MIEGHTSLADRGVCLSPPARLWTLSKPTTLPVTLNSSAHIVPLSHIIPRRTIELHDCGAHILGCQRRMVFSPSATLDPLEAVDPASDASLSRLHRSARSDYSSRHNQAVCISSCIHI